MKKEQRVRTINGTIETVMTVEPARIVTYESAARLSWYHPAKVWPISATY